MNQWVWGEPLPKKPFPRALEHLNTETRWLEAERKLERRHKAARALSPIQKVSAKLEIVDNVVCVYIDKVLSVFLIVS